MTTNKAYLRYTIILSILIIYTILIISLIRWFFLERGTSNDIQSATIIILAIVISVLTFTIASSVFAALGKSNNNTPLGMPDGSIRALIALSLITLFFILATQIYSKVSGGSVGKLERLSEENLKELSVKDIIGKEKTDSLLNPAYDTSVAKKGTISHYVYFYNVSVKVAPSSDASDMAKNIIASFTALIAAICGFYFGTASTRPITNQNNPPTQPKITPKGSNPTSGTIGNPLVFEWDVSPAGLEIVGEIIGTAIETIEKDLTNPLKFSYTPTTAGVKTLKVHLKENSSVFQQSQITIT